MNITTYDHPQLTFERVLGMLGGFSKAKELKTMDGGSLLTFVHAIFVRGRIVKAPRVLYISAITAQICTNFQK